VSSKDTSGLARWRRFAPLPLIVLADLWSKSAVFGAFEAGRVEIEYDACGHERVPLLGDWLALMLATNRGMAFSWLENVPWILVCGRIAAVILIAWLLWRARPDQRLFRVALVCVLGGALGNLHDNLLLEPPSDHPLGEVRDFIDVYVPAIGNFGPFHNGHFPTFNVADSFITVGAVLMLLTSVFSKEDPQPAE
jgi:signal peptidase II